MKLALPIMLVLLSGCSTVYYNFWETFGREKRDLLQSNLEKANEEQMEVKEQFENVLDRIKAEYGFDGGELEATYRKLREDYEEAKSESEDLSARIDKVEGIGSDLFKEWKEEAQSLDNKRFKQDSLNKLSSTRRRFDKMLSSMRATESDLQSVLKNFHDQVIYLKHNLNAQSLSSFKSEFGSIENDMRQVLRKIDRSSAEAESFIKEL